MSVDFSKLKCNAIYGVWHVARYDEISNSLKGDVMKNKSHLILSIEIYVMKKTGLKTEVTRNALSWEQTDRFQQFNVQRTLYLYICVQVTLTLKR